VNIHPFVNCLPENIHRIGSRDFKNIVAVHANSVFGIKTGYLFSSWVDIIYAPIFIKGKKTIGDPIENFDKTFLFLKPLLKCFPVDIPQLLSNKSINPFRVLGSLLLEIFTGKASGYFLEKIFKYIVTAVGLGNQPAVNILSAMGITEDLETAKKLPALLPFLQT
jgi:hypothetical protein